MRRILTTITLLVAVLFGLPATAQAAANPLGGGSDLFTLGGPGGRCSASFAATGGGTGYLIAGPACAASVGTPVYSGNNVLVGPIASVQDGIVLVQVTNTTDWKLVAWVPFSGIDIPIHGSTEAPVGGTVCLASKTTGLSCGTITAKNQTINYPEGTLTGLTRTTVCLEPGGVAFFSGDQAQGVPIGGSGCTSYFRPINQTLAAYGLSLLTN
jgi:hypothetical protein